MDEMLADEVKVCSLVAMIVRAIIAGNTVFTCGNGGSAAEAEHLVGELIGRYKIEREPLPAISLTSGVPTLTCISNDYDFSQVFARPLKVLGKKGDILIMYSTSGNSANVRMAGDVAFHMGIQTFLITGKHHYDWHSEIDGVINIPSEDTARIQECTTILTHVICAAVDDLAASRRANI